MKFTKEYTELSGLTEGIRTHWTTSFYIDDCTINAYRTIKSKLYKLSIPLEIGETFSNVLSKVDRLVRIDNDMWIDLAEIAKRDNEDIDSEEL